ncbi:polysaccharide biosynthesis C-terminal domain-containing protein, partial [uncultured Methanobrevibacter sp.]|uniref:MATE family efflux transporter n=1 Tax=uncultured Methanobrevibacter sp. TaxID=253161 RepID=UPI0025F6DB86
MLISVAAWILIILSLTFLDNLLHVMKITKAAQLVKLYLIPMFLFSIIIILSNVFPEAFQSEGNSKTPTLIIIGTNILNLILDPILIFYLQMGVEGAIYATLLSSALSVAIFFYL